MYVMYVYMRIPYQTWPTGRLHYRLGHVVHPLDDIIIAHPGGGGRGG